MREPLPTDFDTLVTKPDEALDIARIALALAADAYPGLDVGVYVARLDAMAEAIADAADATMPLEQRLAMLDRQIFEVEGFEGNRNDYYDPRNSLLNDVIERRKGNPITLSVVYLEVGWRLGLPLVPVSFPGHFLVSSTGRRRVFIDSFNRGARVDRAALVARLVPLVGSVERAREYLPRALASASRREVALRMLRNLKGIYARKADFDRLLVVFNRIVALDPADAPTLRDRANLLAELECHRSAYRDYRRYLQLSPQAADAADVRARIERLHPVATRMN